MFAPPPLPRTLDAALRDLSSPRETVRVSAMRDLVRHAESDDGLRERAVPLLTQALSDTASIVRAQAAIGLADLKAALSLPALLLRVEDDDGYVRQMAVRSLGEIGDARAKGRLKRALADERPEVRYQAIVAYCRLEDDARDAAGAIAGGLSDSDADIRTIALRVADERCESAADREVILAAILPRVRELVAKDSESALTAALFLLAHGEKSEPALALVRRAVHGELNRAPQEDIDEALIVAAEQGLADVTPVLERRAFGLARFLRHTSVWHARVALAVLGHKRAIDGLLADLRSKDGGKRHAALVAVGRARLSAAKDDLANLLASEDGPLARETLALIDGRTEKRP